MKKKSKSIRKGTTDDGRIIITTTHEEPKSARGNARYYQLWKLASELNLEEIEFLITKRKNDLKYVSDVDEIKVLRTEISILGDTYNIVKKKMKRR